MRPPRLETLEEKKLVGMWRKMTFADHRVRELWRTFRPRVSEVRHRLSRDFISMKVFEEPVDGAPGPDTVFEQWAAVEVDRIDDVPEGMDGYTLPGGIYAVFTHEGPASAFARTTRYIFGSWLPSSEYTLDDRPQFEVMGEDYRPDDPDAEEEFWIPVRVRDD